MDNSKLTPLSELGEFGLIDELTKDVSFKNPSTLFGIGDDAAVIKAGGKKRILISKDLL
jgi:thiamine-monophosphate kinase